MFARSLTWILLTSFAVTAAHAQVHGIAQGIVSLVLGAILVAVALILALIWHFVGKKAALAVLAVLVCWAAYTGYGARQAEAKRTLAGKSVDRAFTQGCAEATRTLYQSAKGDEQIYVRTHGAELVPQYQHHEVLPSARELGEGVELLLASMPQTAENAILVDITYDRELVAGSYPGYEWLRTTYELKVTTVPGGIVLAHSNDKEARSGFCLGDLEAFLQVALNRRAVLHRENAGLVRRTLPDAYVRADYSEATSGRYLESGQYRHASQEIKAMFVAEGCQLKEASISPHVAVCDADSKETVEVPLFGIVALTRAPGSWLLVYQVHKNGEQLNALRVEQRLRSWKLVRTWSANAGPRPGPAGGGEYLQELALDGEALVAAVYSGRESDLNRRLHWFQSRSALRVPLPGMYR